MVRSDNSYKKIAAGILLIICILIIIVLKWIRPGPLQYYATTFKYSWNPFVGWDTLIFHRNSYLADIAVMVPVGILMRYLVKNRILYLFIGACICFVFETAQSLLKAGVSDLLSIICMYIGFIVGYICFITVCYFLKLTGKEQK